MAANPEAGAVTDEASAVQHVAGLLSEPERPTEDEDPTANPEGEPEEAEEQDPKAKDTSSEEAEESEPEGDQEELPDTLEGLAKALEMDPGDLAGHLKVPITVNGKVTQVTLADAMKGQQLESDYRQKTSELAEQRKQLDAQAQQVHSRWQQQAETLSTLIQAGESLIESGPSAEQLAQLMEDDPTEYLRVKAHADAQNEKLTKLKEEQTKLRNEQRAQAQQRSLAFRQEQQKQLAEKLPDFRDPAKARAFEDKMSSYLRLKGMTDDEIGNFVNGPFDHRQILILADAMDFGAMKQGKDKVSKKLKALPKVAKPGAARREKDSDKLTASRDRLRRLKSRGSKQQQTDAAVEMVKGML